MSKSNGNGAGPQDLFAVIQSHMAFDKMVRKVERTLKKDKESSDRNRLITYFSNSHEKQRYFMALPSTSNKARFSYESTGGLRVTREAGKEVIKLLNLIGYEELTLIAAHSA